MRKLINKKTGIEFTVPYAKRGNSTYAWEYGKQFAEYKQRFSHY